MQTKSISKISGNNERSAYTIDEFMGMLKDFHGSTAPGLVIGGFMVDHAIKNLPEGEFFDALCETGSCLPDAIQLLTPCTTGNGWLKVFDSSRYAIAMYDKYTGKGVRVHLDASKLENWPEVKSWFFKLKPKKEQNFQLLIAQIIEAGAELFGTTMVQIKPELIEPKKHGSKTVLCESCGEAFRAGNSSSIICPACQGGSPYVS